MKKKLIYMNIIHNYSSMFSNDICFLFRLSVNYNAGIKFIMYSKCVFKYIFCHNH